jgi:hypothetical protein
MKSARNRSDREPVMQNLIAVSASDRLPQHTLLGRTTHGQGWSGDLEGGDRWLHTHHDAPQFVGWQAGKVLRVIKPMSQTRDMGTRFGVGFELAFGVRHLNIEFGTSYPQDVGVGVLTAFLCKR